MDIRVEEHGAVLVVFNRAEKRGALTPEFYAAIREGIARAQDPKYRAVILTSAGTYFCAGGDLNVLATRAKLPEDERRGKIDDLNATIRAIRQSPVPVIAAIEGGAAGAGLSIALACDLLTAGHSATFTAAYVKAGLVPDGALTSALARCLPRHLAMEMCLLARPQSAERLAQAGVISELTKDGRSLEAAMDLAQVLSKGPREAQGVIRALVANAHELREEDQLIAERNAMAAAQGGAEAAEGIAAFLAKRKAVF